MRQKQYIAIGILTAILATGGLFGLPRQANAHPLIMTPLI